MKTKIFLLSSAFLFLISFCPAEAATVDVNPSADAFVDDSQPSRNFGTDTDIDITSTPDSYRLLGFVSFDFRPFLPTGATLQKAVLKLYQRNRTCASMPIDIYALEESWSENSVTWAHHPMASITNHVLLSLPATSGSGTATADVTQIVRDWSANRYPNYGLSVANLAFNNCFAAFSSREGDHTPLLELTYSLSDNAGPVISGLSASPTPVSARFTWSTNEPSLGTVMYRKRGLHIWQSKPESGRLDVVHDVTATGLEVGTRYEYQVKTADANGNQTLSEIKYFTTGTLQLVPGANTQTNPQTPIDNNSSGNETTLDISEIQQETWNSTTVRLTWHSNLASTSWAFVSANADDNTPINNYEILRGRNDGVTEHEIFVDDLDPNVDYSFRVFSRSADNQTDTSSRHTFTLANQSPAARQAPASGSGNNGDTGYQPLDANDTGDADLDQVRQQAAAALGQSGATPSSVMSQAEQDQLKKDILADYKAHKSGIFFLPLIAQVGIALVFLIALVVVAAILLHRHKKKNSAPASVIPNSMEKK